MAGRRWERSGVQKVTLDRHASKRLPRALNSLIFSYPHSEECQDAI